MSWTDKQLRKYRREQEVRSSFDNFLLLSIDYMYRKLDLSHDVIMEFLNFVIEQIGFVRHDAEYFKCLNEALLEEIGIGFYGDKVVEMEDYKEKENGKEINPEQEEDSERVPGR